MAGLSLLWTFVVTVAVRPTVPRGRCEPANVGVVPGGGWVHGRWDVSRLITLRGALGVPPAVHDGAFPLGWHEC